MPFEDRGKMSDQPSEDQFERQRKLETDAAEEGVARYKSLLKERLPSNSRPGMEFIQQTFAPLATAIREEQEAIIKGESRHKLKKYDIPLLSLDADKLALISLQCIFNLVATFGAAGSPPTVAQIARLIGKRGRLERDFDLQRERNRDVPALLEGRNRNWNAKRRARELAKDVDKDAYWSEGYRDLHLGNALVNLAVKHTGAFERVMVGRWIGDNYREKAILRLTQAANLWLQQRHSFFEVLATPIHMPMIVPPRAWTGLRGGGYLTINNIELVKHRKNPRTLAALKAADIKPTLDAVNALQRTAWCVNSCLYQIMRKAWDHGCLLGGLPQNHQQPLPNRLSDNAKHEDLKRHKMEKFRIHTENSKSLGNLTTMKMRMDACVKLLREEHLYFPYQLDHRGRAYPIPQVFNPQSDDSGRALLIFAIGKQLGERGAFWLAVHVANMYGYNKASFDERVQWVRDHEDEIRAFVYNPLRDHAFWDTEKIDKPWCLLAACLEWVSYLEIGPSYESHLPIAMDGTCNGLQHLSAMGLDEIGGKATNLIPGTKPEDIYQKVADLLKDRIKANAEAGKKEAIEYLRNTAISKIDRELAKRATMTTPYGVTPNGVREQLLQDGFTSHLQDKWTGADYLSGELEHCIGEVVVMGRQIMVWLKTVAKTLAAMDRGVRWTAPTGFPIVHEYRECKARKIVTQGHSLLLYDENNTLTLKKRKQANAMAPNFVHSLDAAHMMLTVNRLYQAGLQNFAMVHDSYAVHACDVDRMNNALREEFVKIYRQPVMAQFLDEQRSANPDVSFDASELRPPQQGNLNIEDVLRSGYFFS